MSHSTYIYIYVMISDHGYTTVVYPCYIIRPHRLGQRHLSMGLSNTQVNQNIK